MTTLIYYLIDADGEETMPRLEVVGEIHGAVHWFADMAAMVSVGALERLGFTELLKFARKGDVLIVPSLDRLGTDAAELRIVFQAFKKKGVTIISLR